MGRCLAAGKVAGSSWWGYCPDGGCGFLGPAAGELPWRRRWFCIRWFRLVRFPMVDGKSWVEFDIVVFWVGRVAWETCVHSWRCWCLVTVIACSKWSGVMLWIGLACL